MDNNISNNFKQTIKPPLGLTPKKFYYESVKIKRFYDIMKQD